MGNHSNKFKCKGGTSRTIDQIKEKWRKLNTSAKNEKVKEKASRFKTGGGPEGPEMDVVSKKILELNSDAPNFVGIQGGVEIGLGQDEMPSEDIDLTTVSEEAGLDCLDKDNGDICGVPASDENLIVSDEHGSAVITLPDNETDETLVYDIVLTEKKDKPSKISKKKTTKRAPSVDVEELQRQVLNEDMMRIKEERELIALKKEKLELQIKLLKLDVQNRHCSNES